MEQNDNRLDPLILQNRNKRVGRLGFVEEIPPLNTGGGNQRVGRFQRHADKGDLDVVKALDPIGGQRRFAGFLMDDVGGQPLEVGSGVWLGREVAAVDGMTASVLHAEQFGNPFVKFMVAYAGDVELHRVERFYRWFIMKKPRKSRRPANEVSRGDGQAELLILAQL